MHCNFRSIAIGHRMAPLLAVLALTLLAGCATQRTAPQESLLLVSIRASENINPDINQRPSPIELHVFFLRHPSAFLSQDYYSLTEHPEQVLGQDLISRDSMIITPGQASSRVVKADGEYEHIGIVAAFRDLDGSRWRYLATPPDGGVLSSLWPDRWKVAGHKRSLYLHIDEREITAIRPTR